MLDNIDILFEYLEKLEGVTQREDYHPEGDAFNHSLQVLYHAFRETKNLDLTLAAMLHDIGKAENTLGHDKIAVENLKDYVSVKTLWLIEHHIRVKMLLNGEMKKLSKVKALIEHPWFPELILLNRWDQMGRNPHRVIKYDKEHIVSRLYKCIENHFKKEN